MIWKQSNIAIVNHYEKKNRQILKCLDLPVISAYGKIFIPNTEELIHQSGKPFEAINLPVLEILNQYWKQASVTLNTNIERLLKLCTVEPKVTF